MKKLNTVNLKHNNLLEMFLRIENIHENERCEYFFPLENGGQGLCSGINFDDWEHIMLGVSDRCPTYKEMCKLKDLFWNQEEIAFQVHPPKSEYINLCKYNLHLWRNKDISKKTEKSLKVRIEKAYEEAKKYFKTGEKEIFDDEKKMLILFCGDEWLTWEEVCKAKKKYWKEEEAAVQFNVSEEFDLNEEHIIILWDADNFLLPDKSLV